MKTSRGATRSIIAVGATLWAWPAAAQLWNPLDTVPRPNAILGHDTSVTMGIDPQCDNCHGAGDPRTRLDQSKYDILATLPLFRDYFVFGGFEYSGCGYAKINGGTRILPTPGAPNTSYNRVYNQIAAAEHCGSRENYLPNNGIGGCITATPNCIGDYAVIRAIMEGQLDGFDPADPWDDYSCRDPSFSSWCENCSGSQSEGGPCHYVGPEGGPLTPGTWGDVAAGLADNPELGNISTCTDGYCVNPVVFCDAGGSYQVEAALLTKLQQIQWPRWYEGNITGADVQRDLCDPVERIFNEVATEMRQCSSSRYVLPPDTGGNWCVPGQIANSACAPGSPLYNTCVCDNSNPLCQTQMVVRSDCGNILTWKARQQVAVCETYDRSQPGRFGTFFRAQPDNVVNAGGCRENVAMFFTDGYMGGTPGTTAEALSALPTYTSFGGRSNMFVFRVANVFTGDANSMMDAVTRGQITQAYLATDLVNMQVSFARVLNRVYKGVYTGAAMGTDGYGTRAAFHSFTVPGYSLGAPIGDDYLGWPARISWHEIEPDGDIVEDPIFETDWRTKANAPSSCGASRTLAGGYAATGLIGPGGNFRNGVARSVNVNPNLLDRTGDDQPDAHPALTFGRMFSNGSTRPLVVEAPRQPPEGRFAGDFFTFARANRTRPRMIYAMSNGWVHGIDAGVYRAPGANRPTYGYQKLATDYDDAAATSGAEVFRFAPIWVGDGAPGASYDVGMNDLVQQPLITGQLTAADVYYRRANGTEAFGTVLVGAQGKTGRGMFSIDVTDPCNPTVLAQWRLPANNDRASNEPTIYTVATAAAPRFRPAVIVTGGLNGSPNIYAYDIATGQRLFERGLPAGDSYPTAPVCVDATGEARATHCYVTSMSGRLIRVKLDYNGSFSRADDITPPEVNTGLVYSTSPAVFFGPDGSPNVVYGSGDFRNLTTAGGQNYVYKAIDRQARRGGDNTTAADVQYACGSPSSTRSGVITLAAGERVISPPVVAKGVVSWTTYTAQATGCAAGTGSVYAMRYDTCDEAIDNNVPPGTSPRAHSTNAGIPAQPTMHRASESLMISKSTAPSGGQAVISDVNTRGGGRPVLKRLYWRPQMDNR